MTNVTALPARAPESNVSTNALVFDSSVLEGMSKIAELMASARISVPKHLVGSVGDCLAIVVQAAQWQMNPYAIAQKTHLINGVLGYEAQLVNAVISSSSLLASRPDYEWFGPWENVIGKFATRKNQDGKEYRVPDWKPEAEIGCGVRVRATLRGETKPRELELLLTQARTRNSTLWADDPRQQLAYLAIKRWARLHAPDVLLGVHTPDELQEIERPMGPAEIIEPATGSTRTEAVKAKLAAKTRTAAAPAADLDDVLSAIASAETMDALNDTKPLILMLSGDDRATAIEAGKARRAALEALAEILSGIDRTDPADLDIWLDEAREQCLSAEDTARVEAAIEARRAG